MFKKFDDLLLLQTGGITVYLGPQKDALAYFESLGYELPDKENPADFFLDVISGLIGPAGMDDDGDVDFAKTWEDYLQNRKQYKLGRTMAVHEAALGHNEAAKAAVDQIKEQQAVDQQQSSNNVRDVRRQSGSSLGLLSANQGTSSLPTTPTAANSTNSMKKGHPTGINMIDEDGSLNGGKWNHQHNNNKQSVANFNHIVKHVFTMICVLSVCNIL